MLRNLLAFALFLATPALHAAPPEEPASWQARVAQELPLLGHRNWILIVDSAYPLQASPGVETIETNAPLVGVLRFVLGAIDNSEHLRPDIFMDAELPFVSDQDAPGASQYRANIVDVLRGYQIQTQPHDKLIATVDSVGVHPAQLQILERRRGSAPSREDRLFAAVRDAVITAIPLTPAPTRSVFADRSRRRL